MRNLSFFLLLLVIFSCSCLDAYLNWQYPPTLETELNPMARALIAFDNVNFMLACKAIGTTLSMFLLLVFYYWRKDLAFITAGVIAVMQVALIVFLLT